LGSGYLGGGWGVHPVQQLLDLTKREVITSLCTVWLGVLEESWSRYRGADGMCIMRLGYWCYVIFLWLTVIVTMMELAAAVLTAFWKLSSKAVWRQTAYR